MKARITILAALVVGICMLGTGGALAVSGLSAGSSASQGQYGKIHHGGGSGVLGEQADSCGSGGTSGSGSSGSSGSGSSSGSRCAHAGTGTIASAQATRQVASSGGGKGGTLPFTGFLAIPVLLVGVGLVGSGVVLRRRLSSEQRSS